jgi:hypothetical protein
MPCSFVRASAVYPEVRSTNSRPDASGLDRELRSVHAARHDDIAEEDIDVTFTPKDVQRVTSITGRQYGVAQILQCDDGQLEHFLIVLDGKNRFRAARSPKRQGVGRRVSLHWFGRPWQEKRNCRSDADLAFDFDVPTQAFRKAIDLAKAEAGATSHLLCREERIERFYLYLPGIPEPSS